jgi:hypothetical protein
MGFLGAESKNASTSAGDEYPRREITQKLLYATANRLSREKSGRELGFGACREGERAGGTFRDVIISGVFPALAWLAIVIVILSFAASLGHGLQAVTAPVGPAGLIAVLVLIPGACLLIEVLLYQAASRRWANLRLRPCTSHKALVAKALVALNLNPRVQKADPSYREASPDWLRVRACHQR